MRRAPPCPQPRLQTQAHPSGALRSAPLRSGAAGRVSGKKGPQEVTGPSPGSGSLPAKDAAATEERQEAQCKPAAECETLLKTFQMILWNEVGYKQTTKFFMVA